MPKGMFTQGVCLLLEREAAIEEIEARLRDYDVLARRDPAESWEFGGPTLIVGYRPDTNGLVAVDTVSHAWPDQMGDMQEEPVLMGAWSMGHFGPFAYPGGLKRAAQQSWGWAPGKTVPAQHRALVRIRASYAFGAAEDDPVMPADYEPLPELEFVTELADALLDLPGALCYFNPNGEVLRDQAALREDLQFCKEHGLPPLPAWSNVRLFNVDASWSMMDTVGNGQLDLPDAEACFHGDSYDFGEVDNFLRNISLYLLENGEVIRHGDTMDGPGGIRWQSHACEAGLSDPPRPTLRWLPLDDRPVPDEIV